MIRDVQTIVVDVIETVIDLMTWDLDDTVENQVRRFG